MQTRWLAKQNRTSCILFFGGWGMDPMPFSYFPVHSHDLLILYDYTHLQQVDMKSLLYDVYEQIHLVAWSMGVWVAGHLLAGQEENFATTIAINGTLTPIDDRSGIACATFDEMIRTFSKQTLGKFYESMFVETKEAERFNHSKPMRSTDDILHELVALKNHYTLHGPADNIYETKFVGSRDRIFSARNQVVCWGKGHCTVLKVPHFPFYGWPSWDTVIKRGPLVS